MVETATILIGVVVPLIVGPISVFLKSLWDRYNKKEELKKKNIYDEKKLDLSQKINNFYWPVYLKLKTLDRINYKSCEYKNCEQTSDSEYNIGLVDFITTQSDASNDGINNINRKKKKRKKKCSVKGCSNINQNSDLSDKCNKCQYNFNNEYFSDKEIKSDDSTIKINISSPKYEWDNYDVKPRKLNSLRNIEVHNDSELSTNDEYDTDNEILLINVDKCFLKNLDNKILDLCLDVKLLIEKNISIVQPSKNLIKEIVKFTRYTEILSIINKTQNYKKNNYNIEKLGVVNNTEKFLILIKEDLDKYMLNYKELVFNIQNMNKCSNCCYS